MTSSTNGQKPQTLDEKWARLREPFPPEAIGKKPQPLKKNADKGTCPDCGKFHGLPAIHIDYVGHAYVTERLLEVDPAYELVPSARDESGNPLMRPKGDGFSVWAKLTVLGVTKEDVGEGDDEKSAWSDVLKRCAMRHGVAVDLWKKAENSEEVKHEAEPEETYGPCPLCGNGEVVKRKKRDGAEYAKCSLGKYKDRSTCQWVDWEPDFQRYANRDVATLIAEMTTSAQPGASTGNGRVSDPPNATPAASSNPEKPWDITERYFVLDGADRKRACPDCGDGLMQLTIRRDGQRHVRCTNRACKYKEPATAETRIEMPESVAVGGDVNPDDIPF